MVVVREVTRVLQQPGHDVLVNQTPVPCPIVAQKHNLSHHTLPQSLPPVLGKMEHPSHAGDTPGSPQAMDTHQALDTSTVS